MTDKKHPRDYDDCRHSVYLGPVLSRKLRELEGEQKWSVSKTIRIALYYHYGMMKEVGEELAAKKGEEE